MTNRKCLTREPTMADGYRYTIERVEDGRAISGTVFDRRDGMRGAIRYVCCTILDTDLAVGKITEIKINRRKDGSVFVSALGAMDRIFARIKEVRNG